MIKYRELVKAGEGCYGDTATRKAEGEMPNQLARKIDPVSLRVQPCKQTINESTEGKVTTEAVTLLE